MRRPIESRLSGKRSDDRGVSEVIGFILVFAIIITSVTLLSMTGFQAMRDYQEGEQLRNAQRAIEAFAENANDVMRYDAIDTRQGELSLHEGTIRTSSGGTVVNITANDGDQIEVLKDLDGDDNTVNLGEFIYTVDNDRIAYEGGGVVRGAESGSVFLKQPQLRCDTSDETAVISLVAIAADNSSIQSSGQVGFTVSEEERASKVYTDVNDVSVDIEPGSENERAWNRTLGRGDWERTDDIKGTCDFTPDSGEVVVTLTKVDIEY